MEHLMEIGCICRLINQLFATIQNEIGVDLSLSASCGATRMCDAASVVRRALRTSEGTSSGVCRAAREGGVVLNRRREMIVVLLDLHHITCYWWWKGMSLRRVRPEGIQDVPYSQNL